jgi:tRNA (guanine37-N1)-methyltransferase
MKSLAVVVPKKKAEPVRRRLLEKGALRKDLQVRSDAKNVYLPVTQRMDVGYPFEDMEFDELNQDIKDYRVLVDLPEALRPKLPSSYDTLGSIALVKVADEALPYAKNIGDAIIATQNAIRTVCLDSGVVDQFRTRDIKVIAGEKTFETVHREYGMVFRMDVSKVFFSPRIATERDIVAKQVEPGETVIDMFAGIGPFSIMIAKTRKPKVVYAIDANPDAIRYMRENVVLNKADAVRPIEGDAREQIAKLDQADRIIMNLPHDARGFLPDAIRALKPGGVVHFYEIMEERELEERAHALADIAVREARVMKEIARRRVKSYSPTMAFYAFDLRFL